MLDKHANNQKGVSGPRELVKLASEFVASVKQQAAEKNITSPDGFIKVASESLIKFSSQRNLSPAIVERIATLFNSAKVSSSLHKTALNSRGGSVALMDPREIVQKYKEVGLRKGASDKPKRKDPFKAHREQMALTIVDKDAEGLFMGDDISTGIFDNIRQGLMTKRAAAEQPKSLVEKIGACKEEDLLLAKHSYMNDINTHLRKMCSIVAVSGGPDAVDFLSDVHATRPDLLGAASSFAKVLTKNASTSRKKIKLKSRQIKPAILRSYGGLSDHLIKVADLQRRHDFLETLVKTAAGRGLPSPDKVNESEGGSENVDRDGNPGVASERVLSLFSFDSNGGRPGEKQASPAVSRGSPVGASVSNHLNRLRENKPEPSKALVDADNSTKLKSTFMSLMHDEALADEDPYALEEALNTLHGVAPHLATNPAVARVVVRSMMQYDGVDPLAIKQFAESEREMLRSLEAGRGNFESGKK